MKQNKNIKVVFDRKIKRWTLLNTNKSIFQDLGIRSLNASNLRGL